jgi:hypothetical protein
MPTKKRIKNTRDSTRTTMYSNSHRSRRHPPARNIVSHCYYKKTKAFYNASFLTRYHRQNIDVAPHLMMNESDVVCSDDEWHAEAIQRLGVHPSFYLERINIMTLKMNTI